ncbi:LOW QUALITY PROTEIN: EEF1A lysine methyltransferase 2 [Syngnathoides biaculeatus]|uniref:LOW QUALITY PROTEIN: EEF1A lysine methyltransferase 2 n=1 Tax=Syngnathoides biaculeatus TaxID=300417 RepID=UPI002ADDE322|nr:LOW QUALITY PROTEIN: EEF1A lysine methyltransferase 2 [Syngnathoides biaculeatus]
MDAAMMETSLSIPLPPAVENALQGAQRLMGGVVFFRTVPNMEAAARSQRGSDSADDRDSDTDFDSSQLGTKEYWENTYEKDLETFKDIGYVGEIWFGKESMSRVLRWMADAAVPEEAAILDIGTGNGAFLVQLAKHGYKNLTGIDYSPASVELAKCVLQAEGLTHVKVKEVDFCQGGLEGYDVCVDKGTFDAISLNPADTSEAKRLYVGALKDSLKDQGLFSITSCNWTKEQLLERFSEGFEFVQELPTPTFQFGGKKGNSVTALIFKRVR